jgi:hypothetical protein
LESFAIDGSTRRIKQDPSKLLGGSKLPHSCWTVKYPCVVHMSTCKRTPKCTERARLTKDVVCCRHNSRVYEQRHHASSCAIMRHHGPIHRPFTSR